jgi:hypothetical protein
MTLLEIFDLVNEALRGPFSNNFIYTIPSSHETLLADFYGLGVLANHLRTIDPSEETNLSLHKGLPLIENIRNAYQIVVNELREYFLNAIPYVVSVELRHIRQLDGRTKDKEINRLLLALEDHGLEDGVAGDYAYHTTRLNPVDDDLSHHEDWNRSQGFRNLEQNSYKKVTKRDVVNQERYYKFFLNYFGSNDALINFAERAFMADGWDEMYGGKPWATIASFYNKLKKTNSSDYSGVHQTAYIIDLIIDLQHNTGSALNKINHLYQSKGRYTVSFDWMEKFLDVKAQMPTPFGFFNLMSEKAKQMVSAFYKANYDLSYEKYKRMADIHNRKTGGFPWMNLTYNKKDNSTSRKQGDANDFAPQDIGAQDLQDYDKYKHMIKLPHHVEYKKNTPEYEYDDPSF